MVTIASGLPSTPAILPVQIVQRVAMLGEDDQLALAAAGIAHSRVVLQDAGQLIPFPILSGGDHSAGLLFERFKDVDLLLQLGAGAGGGGLVDQGFFELLLLLSIEIVLVLGDIQSVSAKIGWPRMPSRSSRRRRSRRSLRRLSDWKIASGLEARRRWRAVSANPTEPLRAPASWSALPISVCTYWVTDSYSGQIGEGVVDRIGLALGNSGVPSNVTISSLTMRRMRSDVSTFWTPPRNLP